MDRFGELPDAEILDAMLTSYRALASVILECTVSQSGISKLTLCVSLCGLAHQVPPPAEAVASGQTIRFPWYYIDFQGNEQHFQKAQLEPAQQFGQPAQPSALPSTKRC